MIMKSQNVVGSVTVITNDKYSYKDITSVGIETVKQMLNNPDYKTQCDY